MSQIRTSILFAAIMIGAALAMTYADHLGLKEPADERIFGVVMGIILAWFGNMMPKQSPKECGECGTVSRQNMRRFGGWMFVLAGLAHAGVWLVAPLEHANMLAMSVIGLTLLIVVIRATVTRSWV